jgi:hypothetical protein
MPQVFVWDARLTPGIRQTNAAAAANVCDFGASYRPLRGLLTRRSSTDKPLAEARGQYSDDRGEEVASSFADQLRH